LFDKGKIILPGNTADLPTSNTNLSCNRYATQCF